MSTLPVVGHIDVRFNCEGGSRAYIAGTRVRVQDIVSDHERHGLSPEEIAREHPHLSLSQVYAALAYFHDHREEVRGHMRADEAYVRQSQRA